MSENGDTKKLAIPDEIPWMLAASTFMREDVVQPSSPARSSISAFFFVPKISQYDEMYPNDRLLYLKVIASITSDIGVLLTPNEVLRSLFEGGYPVMTSVIDVKVRVSGNDSNEQGPFFIAASPTRREMIETGAIGSDIVEGESTGSVVGKSLSQLHESSNTASETKSWEVGGGFSFFGLFGGGASGGGTSTSINSSLDRVQRSDNMQRSASQERRELHTYQTEIRNILTLLVTKHLGTRFLQFMLRPRPLHLLRFDPTDPDAWFAEFLRRRSLGIEGMQDLYSIVSIPRKHSDFCLRVELRNFYVYDSLPIPPSPGSGPINPGEIAEITRYLNTVYLQVLLLRI